MSSHTPGPWHVDGVGGIQMDGFRDGYYIGSGDTRKVASVYPYGSKDRRQRWADATLIAAAPDLLAACKAVIGGLVGGSCVLTDEAEALLRAAIRKAEGDGDD